METFLEITLSLARYRRSARNLKSSNQLTSLQGLKRLIKHISGKKRKWKAQIFIFSSGLKVSGNLLNKVSLQIKIRHGNPLGPRSAHHIQTSMNRGRQLDPLNRKTSGGHIQLIQVPAPEGYRSDLFCRNLDFLQQRLGLSRIDFDDTISVLYSHPQIAIRIDRHSIQQSFGGVFQMLGPRKYSSSIRCVCENLSILLKQ